MTSSDDRGSPPAAPRPAFYAGLLLITLVTLALEVLFTRLLSVLTWYSLAFLVIAMGLFGLTTGAVRVWMRPAAPLAETFSCLSRDARLLAASIPAAYVLLLVIPLRVTPTLTNVFLFLVFACVIALPFVPAGMVVATALTRVPLPIGRVYAVDLAGAALGAACVPFLLEHMSAGSALLVLALLATGASAAFGAHASDSRRLLRSAGILAVGVAALLVMNGAMRNGLVPIWVKGRPEDRSLLDFETWNSHSCVQVSVPMDRPAAVWGPGARCQFPIVRQRLIVIDGDAATPVFYPRQSLQDLRFLDCDVTNLAHAIRPDGPAAIIGVGGSRDVQAALMFGHRPVVGIEFNRKLLGILRGHIGQGTLVTDNMDVTLVGEEARSFLTRTPLRFRLIQASLIDTWASTGAGAHALGENGLYTLEAWQTFLDRLEPGGVLTVSRWASAETARLVSLASAALLSRGAAHPDQHVILARGDTVTTIIVGRDPLTAEDTAAISRIADEKGFELLVSPALPPETQGLRPWLEAGSEAALARMTLSPTLDFRPPTDDRPFFFNVVRPRAFWKPAPAGPGFHIEGNQAATSSLVIAFFVSILLSAAAILVPIRLRTRTADAPKPVPWAGIAYFALIGLGFMLFEMGLLQRLTMVLGHPDLSLRVVLASIVGSAAAGAYLSDRLPLNRSPWCYAFPIVIASVGATLAFGLPAVLTRVQLLGDSARIGLSVLICSLSGVALGTAFPAGMRLVRLKHDSSSPWLWGINGVGSVVASSLAVIVALEAGLHWLFLLSACCYLALLPAIGRLKRASE